MADRPDDTQLLKWCALIALSFSRRANLGVTQVTVTHNDLLEPLTDHDAAPGLAVTFQLPQQIYDDYHSGLSAHEIEPLAYAALLQSVPLATAAAFIESSRQVHSALHGLIDASYAQALGKASKAASLFPYGY